MFSQGNTDKQRYNIKHMFEIKKDNITAAI